MPVSFENAAVLPETVSPTQLETPQHAAIHQAASLPEDEQLAAASVDRDTTDYLIEPAFNDLYPADSRERGYQGSPSWQLDASLLAYERSQRFPYGTQTGLGITIQTAADTALNPDFWEAGVRYSTGSGRTQDIASSGYLDRESSLLDLQGNRIWRHGTDNRSLDLVAGIRGIGFSDGDSPRDIPNIDVTEITFQNVMFGANVGAGTNLRYRNLFCGGRVLASLMNNSAELEAQVRTNNSFPFSSGVRTATRKYRTFATAFDLSAFAGFNVSRHTEVTFGVHALVMNNVFTTDISGPASELDEDGETVDYVGGSLMLAHRF